MENIKCPKCGSTQLTANKKGFSGKKAVVGGLLTGGVGLLAGTIGSNKVEITCLACGHQFKPGSDLDAVKKKKQQEAEAIKSPIFWVIFIGMIIGVIFLISKCSNSDQTQSEETPTVATISMSEPEKVNFSTYEEWDISPSGKGKLIIIESSQTNIETLKKLGAKLNYDSKDDLFVTVLVYNGKKAAGMYHSLSSLSDKENAYYDKHLVAVYSKNKNTGLNKFNITVHGLEGEAVEVKY